MKLQAAKDEGGRFQLPKSILNEHAILQLHHAAHAVRQIQRVGDDDQGDAFFAIQFEQELGELLGGGAVQSAGRFVGQQKLRLVDQGAHDGDTLAFAAGKFARSVREASLEANALQKPRRAGGRFLALRTSRARQGGHENIFQNRALGQQMMRLKNKTDLAIPHSGELVVIQPRQILPSQ